MQTILVTGAAGFIGSNFVRTVAVRGIADVKLVAFDKLTYAGNLANIQDVVDDKRVVFVKGDICDTEMVAAIWDEHKINQVVNFAAETHVDRSILDPLPFIEANVRGTQVLLDVGRRKGVEKFVQVGTDEVYGTLPEDDPSSKFREDMPLLPNSPYSATKAAADCLVRAAFHTYKMPVMTTRCSNNYGPYQFPEKAIPLFVSNLFEGKKIPLYGDGLNVRDWLYVEDHCDAIWTVLNKGVAGEIYNVGGNNELKNRELVAEILKVVGKTWEQGVQQVKDRPGHDRRYAIDAGKIKRELGWEPKYRFPEAIKATIQWYRDNEAWWRAIKSGEYLKYYERQYVTR